MKNSKSPADFVTAWQSAPSLDHAARAAGLTKKNASAKASWYRSQGIPLKLLQPGRLPLDIEGLQKLAKRSLVTV